MPSFGVAVAWMVLAPLAYLTNILGIAALRHYQHLYHSADVALISLLVTTSLNVLLLVPIPAIMELTDMGWGHEFCSFYTWLTLTLRSSHLIVLLVLNVYWLLSLRTTSRGHLFVTSIPMKFAVLISWFVAVIVGIMPPSGGSSLFDYYEDGVCQFLPHDVSLGFGLLFIAACLTSVIMGLIGSVDAICLFKSLKEIAESKNMAARFRLPEVDGKAGNSPRVDHKYNELSVAMELCRLGIFVTMVSGAVNDLPFTVLQFLRLLDIGSRTTLEDVSLWLLLIEALIFPHFLWLFSKRYRHPVVYYWKLVVLRKRHLSERDASACPLQTYRLRAKEYHEKIHLNGIRTPQINGGISVSESEGAHASGIRGQSGNKVTPSSPTLNLGEPPASSSTDGVTTDLEDGMAVLTELRETRLNVISGERMAQGSPAAQNSENAGLVNGGVNPEDYIIKNAAARHTSTLPRVAFIKTGNGPLEDSIHSGQAPPSSTASSPCKSLVGTPHRQVHGVKRSASTNSRREWKERFLKKQLPAIFMNTSKENETRIDEELNKDKTAATAGIVTTTTRSSNEPNESPTRLEKFQNCEQVARPDVSDSEGNLGEKDFSQLALKKREPSSEDSFYISSEYHYNHLGDDMPRRHSLRTQGTTESDGVSNTYDADDIKYILDDSSSDAKSAYSRDENVHKEPKVLILEDTDIVTRHDDDRNFVRDISIRHKEETSAVVHVEEKDVKEDNVVYEIKPVLNSQHNVNPTPSIDSDNKPIPFMRRSKYLKYLKNSSLKVSSVDEEDTAIIESLNENVNGINSPPRDSDKVTLVDLDSVVNSKKETPTPLVPQKPKRERSKSDDKPPLGLIPEEEKKRENDPKSPDTVSVRLTDEHNEEFVDPVVVSQDYNQLETVSGSELLHLKLQAMRSATAVSFDDDEEDDDDGDTSDDGGGVTNYAFEGDGIENHTKQNRFVQSKSEDRDSLAENLEVKDGDVESKPIHVRYVYGSENGNSNKTDSKDRSDENQSNMVTPSGVILERSDSEETDFKLAEKRGMLGKKDQTNPFLRESFEVLSQTPEYKTKINSLDNPFTKQDSTLSQPSETPVDVITTVSISDNDENIIHVTSSAPRPPLVIKSTSASSLSDRVRSKPPIPAKPNVKPLIPIKKPSRLPKKEAENSNSHTNHPSHAKTNKGEDKFNRPRTSSEAELEKIFIRRESSGFHEDPTIPVEDPSTKSMPILEARVSTPLASSPLNGIESIETGSTSSDHSIVIEPYGQRRPPWLDDVEVSDSRSSQGSITLPEQEHLISESDNDPILNPLSPDFLYTVQEFKPCEVVEYPLDAVNFDSNSSSGYGSGESNAYQQANGSMKMALLNNNPSVNNSLSSDGSSKSNNSSSSKNSMITPVSAEERPTLQFFHFDDDIERGFEDALSMEYMTQSNAYSGFGLCFESIREEPEDSLSESASSFDGLNDSNASSIFKTQAIISRPSSRASVASSSNLEVAPANKVIEDFNQGNPSTINGHLAVDTPFKPFETSERTSADGREETATFTNGNGFHPAVTVKTSKSTSNGSISFSLNGSNDFWNDFQDSNDDFKSAKVSTVKVQGSDEFDLNDDVFVPNGIGNANTYGDSSNVKSPWLDIGRNTPADLDMSFESDFSHQSGEGELDVDGIVTRQVVGSGSQANGLNHKRTDTSSVEPVYF